MLAATDSQKISDNWKRACSIYPVYTELSKRFDLGIQPSRDLEAGEAQNSTESLVRAEQWFREADKRIEVHHLRKLLSQITLDENVLHAMLARHLGKEPKTESDRDKIDFLLVQYLAQCLPANVPAHELSLEQAALVLKPILGAASEPTEMPALEQCIESLNLCHSLSDFLDHMILERGRALKVAGREKPFDPSSWVAFTRFSFLVRLGAIRLVHEDIDALQQDLKTLESAGVKTIDCRSADLSEKESFESIRKMSEKWKQSFPGKYSQNYWFTDVVRIRAAVRQELERLEKKKTGAGSETGQTAGSSAGEAGGAAAKAGQAQLGAEVAEYIHAISEQVKSVKGARAANAIKVGDLRLMLSSEEVSAFRETSGDVNTLLQHAVAVRAVLLAACDKPDAIDLKEAKDLAQSEATGLQEQIAAAKEKSDTDLMVTLTACARSLQKAVDKANKA
ncbi:MAG TPA: hypothetical protein VK699_11930 [Terriglobales bacterium]|jgi:hypothetical protein|nr:hypothetical protein [Terriglobales bacterium]